MNHKPREDDFYFAKDGTTELKLDVLPSPLTKNLATKMIGDFHTDKPKFLTEKLAGGQTACMGFVRNRKSRGDAQYGEITYLAKGIDWERKMYPEEFAYLKEHLMAVNK